MKEESVMRLPEGRKKEEKKKKKKKKKKEEEEEEEEGEGKIQMANFHSDPKVQFHRLLKIEIQIPVNPSNISGKIGRLNLAHVAVEWKERKGGVS